MAKRHPAQRRALRLLRAIESRDIAAVYAEIDAGADPNGFGRYETSPLRVAAVLPDAPVRDAMTELLLAAGADPNRHLPGYPRPLFAAARRGYDAVARMMLAAAGLPRDASGAVASSRDGTLLEVACVGGLRWLAERALAEGCRADAVDSHGCTALHHATRVDDLSRRAGKDTAGLIGLMLDHGAPLEQQCMEVHYYPGTALHRALGRGDEAAVRTLVARGADLESRTPRAQRTPLFSGVYFDAVATLRAALACGADVRAVDADGKTLLHEAARKIVLRDFDLAVIELLLAAGADPTARDHKGMTAYQWALDLRARSSYQEPQPTPPQALALAALQRDAAG